MNTDVLSDVLKTIRLSGAIFFDVSASNPWVAEAPPAASIAAKVMPGSQHVMEYHVITSGSGWAELLDVDEAPVQLAPGSVIMFPLGDRHVLSSELRMRAKPDVAILDRLEKNESPPFYLEKFGGGPDETRLICGFIGCDILPFNPVLQALPRMVHIPDGYTRSGGWLKSLINAIMHESHGQRPGAQSVLSKLSELLFIEVVRSYMESLPDGETGWLAALADPRTGSAIRMLHKNPARAWTLEELAKDTGVCRTILVNRFTEYLGVAPMTYLINWRMQLAARMLSDQRMTISKTASAVGYESEAAFSRAFKRCTNLSPGIWRARNTQETQKESE